MKAPTAKSKAAPDINSEAAKPKPATKKVLVAQTLETAPVADVATRLTAKDKSKDSVKTTTAKASKPEAVAVKPKAARTVAPGTIA